MEQESRDFQLFIHEPIRQLKELSDERENILPYLEVRPLGDFSNFIVENLGSYNQQIIALEENNDPQLPQARTALFDTLERLLAAVPESSFMDLEIPEQIRNRRIGLIDLLFAIRSLDRVYQNVPDYKVRMNDSILYQRAKRLADIEHRLPMLQWSDTAIYYPFDDPRSFFGPGSDRNQEIELYITNGGADSIFKAIVQGDYSSPSLEQLTRILQDLTIAEHAMQTLVQKRIVGHFDRLSAFSSQERDGVIPASGDFSAWAHLAGWFLTGNPTFKERLLAPENRIYFAPDSHLYIDLLQHGALPTLAELIAPIYQPQELAKKAAKAKKMFREFMLAHMGGVAKHAPAQLHERSPANQHITNIESMHRATRKYS